MTSANVAFVTPALIKWAIGRSGLTRIDIAKKLGVTVDELELWERGTVQPAFSKAKEFATLCHVPFGYLFLPKTPTSDLPLPDFRMKQNKQGRNPSPAFLEVLSDVLSQHDWYREHLDEIGGKKLPFVSKFTIKDGVEKVAQEIRSELYIGSGLRMQAGTWEEYLRLLCTRAEEAGILVMRSGVVGNDNNRKLSPEEFQGFSITDEFAPTVFLNGADYKTAQIFTLVHELAHIWIGKGGIDNPDPVDVETQRNNIEGFCNEVATEVLIPRKDFFYAWPTKRNESTLQKIASQYWVSTLVVLRRAYDLQVITRSEFIELRERERALQHRRKAAGRADYYRNIVARHGRLLTEAVLNDTRNGLLVYRDAASLLGLKVPSLLKMIETYT